MKLRTDSFVYKLAYGFDNFPPNYQVSLCYTFWKALFSFVVICPLLSLGLIVTNFFSILFMGCVTKFGRKNIYDSIGFYTKDIKILPKFDGKIIPPFLILYFGLFLSHEFVAIYETLNHTSTYADVISVPIVYSIPFDILLGLALLTTLFDYLFSYRFKEAVSNITENVNIVNLVVGFVKAKKEKFCPMIEIVEAEK